MNGIHRGYHENIIGTWSCSFEDTAGSIWNSCTTISRIIIYIYITILYPSAKYGSIWHNFPLFSEIPTDPYGSAMLGWVNTYQCLLGGWTSLKNCHGGWPWPVVSRGYQWINEPIFCYLPIVWLVIGCRELSWSITRWFLRDFRKAIGKGPPISPNGDAFYCGPWI